VEDFQAKRARLKALVLAIERVRKAWQMPAIETEKEVPPAEAPVVPTRRT
jgi:hypothetical protein